MSLKFTINQPEVMQMSENLITQLNGTYEKKLLDKDQNPYEISAEFKGNNTEEVLKIFVDFLETAKQRIENIKN